MLEKREGPCLVKSSEVRIQVVLEGAWLESAALLCRIAQLFFTGGAPFRHFASGP